MWNQDRVAGVLLGTAAGDALGAGYEFGYPTPETVIDMIGGGDFNWAPGEWTDDTSMAICVALALDTGTGIDGIAANFVAWYDTDPADIGVQTRTVLSRRSASAAQMTAASNALTGRTGGNGSLMRTAPVALAYLGDADQCRTAAVRISELTHSDPRAGEACALWSAHSDPRAGEACALWSHAIRHAVVTGTYDGVRDFLTLDASVRAFWGPLLDAAESGEPKDFPKNGWVVHALQTAWWAITHSENLPDALELCVRAGGDTDTTAAIAGGLLGARWGASAIPERWLEIMHGYPELRSDDLRRIALSISEKGTL